MPVKYICDYCNKYEFENDDAALVRQKMLEHADTHRQPNLFADIEKFHEKFELSKLAKPGFLSQELMRFRIKFLQEELDEFCDAYVNQDLEKAFDALIDLTYVALGTAFLMGLPFNDGWKHVHNCNMQKVRAKLESDSKRKSTFDVVKPEGWQPPVLNHLIFDKCEKCGKHHEAEEFCE